MSSGQSSASTRTEVEVALSLRRNLTADVVTALGVGLLIGIVNILLPNVSRRVGVDPIGLAALAAAPFVANVVVLFGGRVHLRTPRQVAILRLVGCGSLVLVPLVPPSLWLVLAFTFWLSVSFAAPVQLRVWGAIYPPRRRGKLVGTVRTGQAASMAAVSLGGGVLADYVGGPPVIATVAVLGAAAALAYSRVRLPESTLADGLARYSARESLRVLAAHPRLQMLMLAQSVWGAGMIAAAPLYPLIQVDRLRLSLSEVGLLGILTAGSTTLSYIAWGALSDRRRPVVVLTLGAFIGLANPVAYMVAPSFALLAFTAVIAGIGNAAMDTGITAALSDGVPLGERTRLMAVWSGLTGMRGVVVPFLASGLVQLGVLPPAAALALCVAVALTGVGLYVYATLGGLERAERQSAAKTGPFRALTPSPRP